MIDHETIAGITAYITGLSEFVRAHYERRMDTVEDQCMEIHDRVSALEAQLASIKTRPLSNAQSFYLAALVNVAAALEGAKPYISTAAIILERSSEIAEVLTKSTFLPSDAENEVVKAHEENPKPDLQAGDPPPA